MGRAAFYSIENISNSWHRGIETIELLEFYTVESLA